MNDSSRYIISEDPMLRMKTTIISVGSIYLSKGVSAEKRCAGYEVALDRAPEDYNMVVYGKSFMLDLSRSPNDIEDTIGRDVYAYWNSCSGKLIGFETLEKRRKPLKRK